MGSLTCPRGHRWDAPVVGQQDTQQLCPRCGAAPVAAIVSPAAHAQGGVSNWATMPVSAPSAVVTAPMPSIAGYQVLGELGRGGMGVVYKARHSALKRLVALKMVLSGAHAGSVELGRFRAEAEAVARLQHSNIVQIYEVGEHEGRPYCALEFVPGGSLAQRLTNGPVDPAAAARLVAALAEGAQHAHEHGIVHRDLKPANVLMGTDGVPKLTDFGLAKTLDSPDGPTRTGTVLGTPSYMAPEQALGKLRAIGPATDVYSLGAILYECLTGRPPFKSETSLDTMLRVATDDAVPPRQLNRQVPRDLETICLKCLRKETGKRYASARDLASDLGRFVRNEPILARPVGPVERGIKWLRRHPAWVAAFALLLLLPVTAFVVWQLRKTDPAPTPAPIVQTPEPAPVISADEQIRYAQQFAQADQERLAGRFHRAEELLADCAPALRGWEWHYLNRVCHWGQHRTLTDCGSAVREVAFGPNGILAVLPSAAGVQLRDAHSGKLLVTLGGEHGMVQSVAFSPDGKQLAAAGQDHFLRIYDVRSGQEVATRDHGARLNCVAYSPDGKWLAAGGGNPGNPGLLWLWNVPLGNPPARKCDFHKHVVTSVTFFANSTTFTSRDAAGGIHGWFTTGGDVAYTGGEATYQQLFPVPRSPAVGLLSKTQNRVDFWLPPQTMMTGYNDPPKRPTGALNQGPMNMEMTRFDDQPDPRPDTSMWSAAYNSDETMLAMGGGWSNQGKIRVYRGPKLNASVVLFGHGRQVNTVSFAPDQPFLASGCFDGTVCIWDPTIRRFDAPFASNAKIVLAVDVLNPAPPGMAFSPDGQRLATLDQDPLTLALWDLHTGQKTVCPRSTTQGWLRGPYFSADGRLAAISGEENRTVCIWDGKTGAKLGTFTDHPMGVGGLAARREGFLLATALPDQRLPGSPNKMPPGIQLIDPASRQKLRTVGEGAYWLPFPVVSPDGRRVAAIRNDPKRTLTLWNTETGQVLLTSAGSGMLRFTDDSRYLIRDDQKHDQNVWDAQTGQPANLRLPSQTLRGTLTFAPDGKLLAWPLDKGEILLWNGDAGRPVATIRGHGSPVGSLVFSADGRRLFTVSSDDANVKVWDTATGLEICTLHHASGSQGQLLLSPDGRRLALRNTGGTFVWDATPLAPELLAPAK